jgi:hypothetical protein
MKTLILKVGVSEYFKIDEDTDMMDFANHYIDFELLHRPTDEEIDKAALSYSSFQMIDGEVGFDQKDYDRYYAGMEYMRNQIFGEGGEECA